jgi:transcriptional regulator GlxA family with amidase domain
VTVSVSRGHTQYDLPQPGHHWCIHFCPVKARGPLTALQWHISMASQRNYLADRMAEIARLHNQPRRPIAQARASLLFQDLLLWIAGLAAHAPRARRSDAAIDRLIALLEERFAEPWTVPHLAERIGLTQDHMARCFRQRLGQTIPRYLLQRRVAHARQLLEITDLPVNRIAARVGMPDAQHFNKQFRRLTGLSPSAARSARSGKS